MKTPERFIGKAIRPVTEDERAMIEHVIRWGSDGYPVAKVGSRHWSWSFRSVSSPRVFPTKREATASFEAFADMIRDCIAYERWVAMVEDMGGTCGECGAEIVPGHVRAHGITSHWAGPAETAETRIARMTEPR